MTKTIYKKALKDGANIVALDEEVTDYHFINPLDTREGYWVLVWGI